MLNMSKYSLIGSYLNYILHHLLEFVEIYRSIMVMIDLIDSSLDLLKIVDVAHLFSC